VPTRSALESRRRRRRPPGYKRRWQFGTITIHEFTPPPLLMGAWCAASEQQQLKARRSSTPPPTGNAATAPRSELLAVQVQRASGGYILTAKSRKRTSFFLHKVATGKADCTFVRFRSCKRGGGLAGATAVGGQEHRIPVINRTIAVTERIHNLYSARDYN
jgi:hypothetical protein